MDYTKQFINNGVSTEDIRSEEYCELREQTLSSVSSLTTYKEVVDIHKKYRIYGLSLYDYKKVEEKIRNQNTFLGRNYIYDKISGTKIALKDLVVSANHNPHRYHALIQNRINTLTSEANEQKLKPIFMTLTLPSKHHRYKTNIRTKTFETNPKYEYIIPRESVKELTRMFSRLRQDRSLKELTKDERIYFRVNEPHKNGTPHTHILLFVPKTRIDRVVTAFKRLFDTKANDIQTNIENATAYIMKYINKTLPLSKKSNLTKKDKYMNAWYAKNRIIRFNCSRTLAPLNLYRLLHQRYNLKELTKIVKRKGLDIFVLPDNRNKIMEVFEKNVLVYRRSENYSMGSDSIDF